MLETLVAVVVPTGMRMTAGVPAVTAPVAPV
jgi:hypothetical protein